MNVVFTYIFLFFLRFLGLFIFFLFILWGWLLSTPSIRLLRLRELVWHSTEDTKKAIHFHVERSLVLHALIWWEWCLCWVYVIKDIMLAKCTHLFYGLLMDICLFFNEIFRSRHDKTIDAVNWMLYYDGINCTLNWNPWKTGQMS